MTFIYFINLCGLPLSKGFCCYDPNWKEKIITRTIQLSIRLMAYRHSLNTKYTKTATPAPRPTADHGGKNLTISLHAEDGSQIGCHQDSVFNDPVVTQWLWIRLCLDGALGTEGHVVDQNTDEGRHHFGGHPWAAPCTLWRGREKTCIMGLRGKWWPTRIN